MALHPCPSCDRHVRAVETACPFCAAAIAIDEPAPRVVSERLGRAALFAFGAAMATSVAACSSATTQQQPDSGAASDAATAVDANDVVDAAGNPDSGFFPPYGTPPPEDAGHDGGLAGAYGAPPPMPDAGP